MIANESRSGSLPIQIGFWSALLIAVLFLLYTVCYLAVSLHPPLFQWTNLNDYVRYANSTGQAAKTIAQLAMVLFGPLYILLLNCIHELTPANQKILTRASLCFGVLFVLCSSTFYFVQISAVRLEVAKGTVQGLEQWVQANPNGGLAAINLLGWSLFFGLSSLFAAPVFRGKGLRSVVRAALLINGTACILGGIGYVLEILILVLVCLTFVMGGAVLVIAICLCFLFHRMGKQTAFQKFRLSEGL